VAALAGPTPWEVLGLGGNHWENPWEMLYKWRCLRGKTWENHRIITGKPEDIRDILINRGYNGEIIVANGGFSSCGLPELLTARWHSKHQAVMAFFILSRYFNDHWVRYKKSGPESRYDG
jgi:hypothetical protein